jgi:hypothetical protein
MYPLWPPLVKDLVDVGLDLVEGHVQARTARDAVKDLLCGNLDTLSTQHGSLDTLSAQPLRNKL